MYSRRIVSFFRHPHSSPRCSASPRRRRCRRRRSFIRASWTLRQYTKSRITMAQPHHSELATPPPPSTKGVAPASAASPALSLPWPPASLFFSPTASPASVNPLAAPSQLGRRSHGGNQPTSLVRDAPVSAPHAQSETPSRSPYRPSVSCTMGLLKSVKSAARRVSSKRTKEGNREKKETSSSGTPKSGDGLAEEEKTPAESEPPDKAKMKLQPYVESVADESELDAQTGPDPQQSMEYLPLSQKFQDKQSPLPQLRTHTQLNRGTQRSSEPANCGLDCESDEESDVSEADLKRGSDPQATHLKRSMRKQGQQQRRYSSPQSGSSVEPYRFPFQSGGGPEDQQSFYSGADKAPSPKASSYRGHGRVDSHASPIVEDHRYNPSIRAEVVREQTVSRDELRRPTLRSQRASPRPEQLQYHSFGDLGSVNDHEFLFSAPQRKLSDEPVSPTSIPESKDTTETCIQKPPRAESVIDSDDSTISDTDSSESDASSDAESEESGSVLAVPRQPQERTRTASMPAMQRNSGSQERNASFDTVCSAEWMKGGPPSSFYPHSDDPADPAAPDRRVASHPLQRRHTPAGAGSPFQAYSPANKPHVRRARASCSAFPSREEVERRVARATDEKRRNEVIKRGQDQLIEERRRQKREKEIYAGRIAELEYEKSRLVRDYSEASLKNGELEKRVANISTRFLEQRRKLTELELCQRGWEDFEAQLKNNAHGLLTPPDTASSRSTPGNPERVIAWAETLADPTLHSTETPAAPETFQKHEPAHEDGGPGRTIDGTIINALQEPLDPTSTKSSSDFSALQNQPCHELQPEMSVQCATQTLAFPPSTQMPRTRLRTLKAATPIYSQSNDSAATFGSEQQPCHRPEPGLNDGQACSSTQSIAESQRMVPPSAASRQTSQSSLRYHNGRPRQPPKQVQFDASHDEKTQTSRNIKDATTFRSRDVVGQLVKQQQKPISRQASPAAFVQQRTQTATQQLSTPRPNISVLNNTRKVQPQLQTYGMSSQHVYQRQQPVNHQGQMAPAHQSHMHAARQHSAPANLQSIQNHQNNLRHAYSSTQVQRSTRPPTANGLVSHAHNAPRPEPPRKSSQQKTLQPPRPSTSHGVSRPTLASPRPSTSHGKSQPAPTHLYPPRPGTSHSTRAATFGSSTVPPLPTIPQHALQQPQPYQHQPQQQVRGGGGTPVTLAPNANYYPFPPPLRGTSARSHETVVSHRTVLSRMQGKARAGLEENERANAEKRTAAQEAAQQRAAAAAASASAREAPSPRQKDTPQWEPQQMAWGRDLVGEGVIQAQEEADKLWREKQRREEQARREDEDRKIRMEMERLTREKMSVLARG